MRATQIRAIMMVAGLMLATGTQAADSLDWQPNLDAAKRKAQQTNRMVLLHFWGPSCAPCVKVEAEVFSKPAVKKAIESHFVPVKMNTDEFPAAVQLYGVDRIPMDVIIAPTGDVVGKMKSPLDPDQYLLELCKQSGLPPLAIASALKNPALAEQAMSKTQPDLPAASGGAMLAGYAGQPAGGNNFGAANSGLPAYGAKISSAMPNGALQNGNQPNGGATSYGSNPVGGTANPAGQAFVGSAYGQLPASPASIDRSSPWNPTSAASPPHVQQVNNNYAEPGAMGQGHQPAAANTPVSTHGGAYGSAYGAGSGAAYGAAPTATASHTGSANNVAGSGYGVSGTSQQANFGATAPNSNAWNQPSSAQQPAISQHPNANTHGGYTGPGGMHATGAATNPANGIGPAGNAPAMQMVAASEAPSVGLEGFCAVTLGEQKRWVKGDTRYGAIHRGRTYLFMSEADQQKFLALPDRFSPAMCGNDPVMAFDQGQNITGKREYGVFYQNRVYMFANPETQAQFKKMPQKYAAEVLQAEAPQRGMMR